MTQTLLEMNGLQSVPRNDFIDLAPMIEEIFADIAPLAESNDITLEYDGQGTMTGSDPLIYRLIFNLTENAVKYNRTGGKVRISVNQDENGIEIKSRIPAAASPRNIKGLFSRHFSESISREAANTAESDWGFRWFGKLPSFTAERCMLRRARTRERR